MMVFMVYKKRKNDLCSLAFCGGPLLHVLMQEEGPHRYWIDAIATFPDCGLQKQEGPLELELETVMSYLLCRY